jgi:hypothetical protein
MIAKGNLHGDGAFLADYLAKDGKSDERAELFELSGFLSENIFDALREANAHAELTHAQKPLFHTQVRLPKDEQLTREQWLEVADRIEKRLGFKGQPRAIVFHIKNGEEHMHIAWDRIDTEKERAIDPGLFKLKLKEVCRELEKEMGLQIVRNERLPGEMTKPAARDEFEESRRLKTDLKEIRENIRECMDHSDSGKAFQAALGEQGYILAQGDRRDYVVIDECGGQHALSKRITGLTAGQTRDRLADIDKANLPGVERAQEIQRERMAERERQRGESERAQAATQKEQEQKAAAPAKEKPLGKTAGEIRLAMSLTDSGQGFASALEDRGLTLFCVTEQDKVNSDRNELFHLLEDQKKGVWYMERDGADKLNPQQLETAEAAYDKWSKRNQHNFTIRNLDIYVDFVQAAKLKRLNELLAAHGNKSLERPDAPHLHNKVEPGDLFVMTDKGYVYALDEKTTGKTSAELDKYLAPLDRASLMSGTDAYQAMQDVKADRFLTRQHEQREKLEQRQREQRQAITRRFDLRDEVKAERLEHQAERHAEQQRGLDAWQYEQRVKFGIADPQRDKAAKSNAMRAAFGKAASEATKVQEPVRLDDMEPNTKPLALDNSVTAFHEHQIRQKADRDSPAHAVGKVERATAKTFNAAAKATTRAADTIGNIADRFMTAAADFLVGGTPQKEWQPRDVEKFTAEWRREVAQKMELERNRTAAIDRMREMQSAGRTIDSGELAHLNPTDLQNIKDRGEAALQELIRNRQIELERQRSRDREL